MAIKARWFSGTSSSAYMASTGHSATHNVQSIHSSGSITKKLGPSRKQSTGQTSTQSVYLQRIQDEVVKSFFPAFHSIRLEQGQVRKLFPNLITEPVDNYLKNYTLRYVGDDRVATRSCHVVEFLPKDNLRYPHVFCIDNSSNLVLRSSTLGNNGEPLLTSFFTEIKLEKNVPNNALSPSYKDTKNWHVENVSLENQNKSNTNLVVSKLPPGFERISEFTRSSPHTKGIMIHQMYSDGLSSFSIFVEESEANSKTKQLIVSKILQNSLSFYSAQVDNHIITVVGDLPMNSIKQIVSSVSFSRSSNQ